MSKSIADKIAALEARIKADTTKLEELRAVQKAASLLDSIEPKTVIRFVYGRGELRGEYVGEVRSVLNTDKGRIIRVIKGEGADEEIVSIRPVDVVGVEGTEQTGLIAEPPQESVTQQGAAVDPLADIN